MEVIGDTDEEMVTDRDRIHLPRSGSTRVNQDLCNVEFIT